MGGLCIYFQCNYSASRLVETSPTRITIQNKVKHITSSHYNARPDSSRTQRADKHRKSLSFFFAITMQLALYQEAVDSQNPLCQKFISTMSARERFTTYIHKDEYTFTCMLVYPNRWFSVAHPLRMELGRYVKCIAIFDHQHENT